MLPHTTLPPTDLDRFLRGPGGEDEDSRALRKRLAVLSEHIEGALRARRGRLGVEAVARAADALARCVREHQRQLTGMGSAWHALQEFGVYQRALGDLAGAIGRWQAALLQRCPTAEAARFREFELLAWRTLGEALLLVDIYQQGDEGLEPLAPHSPLAGCPTAHRTSLLARLRGWLPSGARRKRL